MSHKELERALQISGRCLRDAVDAAPERVARVEAGFGRLLDPESTDPAVLARRIEALRLRLAPLCGKGSAERAMRVAAIRCSADSVDTLTHAQWPAFLAQLAQVVANLCGMTPARAVLEHVT